VTRLLRLLAPRYRAASTVRLSPEVLRAWGIEAVMVDLDNTLVPWGASAPPPAVAAWVAALRADGMRACLVSNSLSGRVRTIAAALDLPAAPGRFKPSADKLRRALALLGTPAARTAMVGDQLFTEVLAGNRLGPLSPWEPLRIRLVRLVERRVLAILVRRGLAPPEPQV
jgi:HAD superfamily phosphatase (TIGR01668 family)